MLKVKEKGFVVRSGQVLYTVSFRCQDIVPSVLSVTCTVGTLRGDLVSGVSVPPFLVASDISRSLES